MCLLTAQAVESQAGVAWGCEGRGARSEKGGAEQRGKVRGESGGGPVAVRSDFPARFNHCMCSLRIALERQRTCIHGAWHVSVGEQPAAHESTPLNGVRAQRMQEALDAL